MHVLSHHAPSELPQRELRLDFREVVHVSPAFERFLARLLAPAPEQRFVSAHAARIALQRGVVARGARLESFAAERLVARVEPDALTVDIAGLPKWTSIIGSILAAAAAIALAVGAVSDGPVRGWPLFGAALMALTAWWAGRRAVRSVSRTRLHIDREGTRIERRLGRWRLHTRTIARGEPTALATRGWFRKRDLLLHTPGATERLGVRLDRRAVEAVEARVRQVEGDLVA